VASWLYFISLILLGGYFAVDLLMGVLGNQYLKTKECAIIAMQKRKKALCEGESEISRSS